VNDIEADFGVGIGNEGVWDYGVGGYVCKGGMANFMSCGGILTLFVYLGKV
jgi:hypothetical protein